MINADNIGINFDLKPSKKVILLLYKNKKIPLSENRNNRSHQFYFLFIINFKYFYKNLIYNALCY